jgi:hypothetical protein
VKTGNFSKPVEIEGSSDLEEEKGLSKPVEFHGFNSGALNRSLLKKDHFHRAGHIFIIIRLKKYIV